MSDFERKGVENYTQQALDNMAEAFRLSGVPEEKVPWAVDEFRKTILEPLGARPAPPLSDLELPAGVPEEAAAQVQQSYEAAIKALLDHHKQESEYQLHLSLNLIVRRATGA